MHPWSETTAPELHRGRLFSLLLLVAFAVLLAGSERGSGLIRTIFLYADALIVAHPHLGSVVFVILAAVSAMLAFFSSALLLPVAIFSWGSGTTFILLWFGWLLGGMLSYTIGRYFGREVVTWIVREERLRMFEERLRPQATFLRVLAFHFVVPSEMPGYILGILGYPFRKYLIVLAIAEIPYAAGAIYLGSTFVEGNLPMFVLLGAGAIALSILSTRWFLRRGAPVSIVT